MRSHLWIVVVGIALIHGCSERPELQELPPPETPVAPPPDASEVRPAIKNVTFQVEDQSGEPVTELFDSKGCTIRLIFDYDGEGAKMSDNWSPLRKSVHVGVGRISGSSENPVYSTTLVAKIERIGTNRFQVLATIQQSIRPNEYTVFADLIKIDRFAGTLATCSLKVLTPAQAEN